MRLQTRPLPGFGDVVVIDPQQPPQLSGAPVRAAIRRPLTRLLQDAGFQGRRQHRRGLVVVARLQARNPGGEKPSPPAIDVVAIARHRHFNHRVRRPIGQHEDHPRAPRVLGMDGPTTQAALEFRAFIDRQYQRHMARQRTGPGSPCTVH